MRKSLRVALLLLVLVIPGVGGLAAQRRFGGLRGRSLADYFAKETPTTDFAIARWYSPNWEGDGWSHDWPASEEHILQIMHEVSFIDADHLSYKVVDIKSPDIFKYPFAYVSHPGEIFPSEEEINNIREYVERGGFIMYDDFGGQGQGPEEMANFKTLLRRAFPGQEMYRLEDDHPMLRLYYNIDNLQMEHPMSHAKSTFYGFNDSHGRLSMVICHDNDIGDYWEFIDEPMYRVKPSAEALKIGVNIAIYTLTH
jgi:hypothetical protein